MGQVQAADSIQATEKIESTHTETSSADKNDSLEQDRNREEAKIRRKFDLRVLPICTMLYFCAFIDRSNMGNARILGLTDDFDLSGYRFNLLLTAFFITYIIFEIPSNIVCKYVGPKIWLAALTGGFGLITMCIGFAKTYGTLMALRTLLGSFEAGILPGILLTLGRFYRRHELATRVGWVSAVASLAGAFGGLLASAFSSIPRSGLMERWRWVFCLEGIITIFAAVVSFLLLPDNPTHAKFLSPEEQALATNRLLDESKTRGSDPFDKQTFKRAILHLPTQLNGIALISSLCCMNSVALFMPTILNDMGFSAIRSQLMSVPPYAVGFLFCIGTATLSDRMRNRGYIVICLALCIVVGFVLQANVGVTGVKYFAIFLATCGGFCGSPLMLSWAVDNSAGQSVKAVVSAWSVTVGSLGALISTWTYLPKDRPGYKQGHYMNMSFGVMMLVAVILHIIFARYENKKRDQGLRDYRVQNKTQEQIDRLGHMHPEFRFTP